MADTTTTEQPAQLGETVPADDADSMKGWTAQEGNAPVPNAREIPQQFVEAQLPKQQTMDEMGLHIPENQISTDIKVLDPADQVRVEGTGYASPLGVTANPEGAHIPGEAGTDTTDMGGSPADKNIVAPEGKAAGDTTPDSTWTKQELQDYADSKSYTGVTQSTQTKDEMLAAITAAGG